MTKLEVQQRVLKDGKPIALELFVWDEETNTFYSREDYLVIDFKGISNCTFKTDYGCTFKTGSNCMFKAGSNCTFNTGSICTFNTDYGCTFDTDYRCTFNAGFSCTFNTDYGCTFKAGSNCTFNAGFSCTFKTGSDCTFKTDYGCTFKTSSNCTFNTGFDCTFSTDYRCTFNFTNKENCVIVRRDIFEVINTNEIDCNYIRLCPFKAKGYLIKIDDKMYLNGNKSLGEHIIVDNILSKVISKKGNIYKVVNHNETVPTYIIKQDDLYSHGRTIKEARDSLIYKISSRDTSKYENLTIDDILSKEECIKMYRAITGACEYGTRSFVEQQKTKKEYSIKEIIELTQGQFGNETFTKFFNKKG